MLNVVVPVLRNLEFETRLSLKRTKNKTETSFSYTSLLQRLEVGKKNPLCKPSISRKFANRSSNIWKTGCSQDTDRLLSLRWISVWQYLRSHQLENKENGFSICEKGCQEKEVHFKMIFQLESYS